jgi:YD repeat-containing protein
MIATLRARRRRATARPAAPRRRHPVPLTALLMALLAFVLGAGNAAAHVGVQPAEPRPATSETFTVRVPTERADATVRVRVVFPDGLTVSRFQPKAGWQREVERDGSGRITAATWSGGRIEPNEYDDFLFIARTPAETGPLAFKAYQTYAGGETVEWVNPGEPGPAPVVNVKPAAAAGAAANPSIENAGQPAPAAGAALATAPAAAAAAAAAGAHAAAASEGATGGSDLPLFAAFAALALALIATAMAGVALSRRPAPAGVPAAGTSRDARAAPAAHGEPVRGESA